SSALRALKAWLFGFPERTGDNFVHANDALLVGGTLVSEAGLTFSFFRRKKRKADLLDEQGDPVSSRTLATFLPILDQPVFESLYGIDHEGLVQGGEDILAQKGDVGQTLFSAGAGIHSLREVITDLEKQADELFKVRGSKQKINETLARYKHLQKTVKEAALSGRDWKTLQNELALAADTLKGVEQERAAKDRDRRRLDRIKQALPQLIQRERLRGAIAEMGTVVDLPDDFSEQNRLIEQQLHAACVERAGIRQKLEELDHSLTNLQVDHTVLEHAEAIEKLAQRLAVHEKAMQDRSRLMGMHSSNWSDAVFLLKQVNQSLVIERVEELRPLMGRRKLIQSLVVQQHEIQQAMRDVEKRVLKLTGEIQSRAITLSTLGVADDSDGLKQALRQARRLGEIDAVIEEKEQRLQESQLGCRQDLDKMGLWSGELVDLLSLPLPLRETISQYETLFQNLEDKKKEIEKRTAEVRTRLADVKKTIKTLRNSGEVPTEEELNQIRAKRQQGWTLLRRQWLDGEDVSREALVYDDALNLPDAYEKTVGQADATADRLRREADRVHQYAALIADENTFLELIQDMKNSGVAVAAERVEVTEAWCSCWAASRIDPLTPKEMQAWLNQIENLRFRVQESQKLAREVAVLRRDCLEARNRLLPEVQRLGAGKAFPGERLAPLLATGDQLADTISRTVEERQNLEAKQREAGIERDQLLQEQQQQASALTRWRQQWTELVSGLAVGSDILPAEAADLLENLQNCFAKLKEAEGFQKRINGIDTDARDFSEAVVALVETAAPDLKGQPLEQTVMQLSTRLKLAVEKRILRDKTTGERQKSAIEAQKNGSAIADLEKKQSAQCRLAGVETAEELGVAEERSRSLRAYQKALAEIERLLIEGAEGLTIEALETQAQSADADELTRKIAALTTDIEQVLDPQIRQLSERMGEKRTELSRMDGSARAAEAFEEGVQELACLSRLVNQYVTLKLATQVLGKEVERFRAENQDPVLNIASTYFRQLTLDSFSGLRTDEDDQGKPVLVGLRKDGSRIQVAQMSSGTRDQLYLALRFASLEWKLQSGEPMPFILDDILINFDDDRSRATLKAMAALSAKTQVILFTHHRRIVEEARHLQGPLELKIHNL
ncbi:MAG: AAA family ATPase, partial [bacterium]